MKATSANHLRRFRAPIALCGLVALAGCTKGHDPDDTSSVDGSPDAIHLTGTIDASLLESRRDGALPVDRLVALPNIHGRVDIGTLREAIVVDLGDDGTFDLELSTDRNWVVLMEATTATTRLDRVQGFVGIGYGDDSLIAFPVTEAQSDLDLGTASENPDGNVTGDTPLEAASVSFSLTTDELAHIARTDGVYELFANAWVNWDPVEETWWETTTNMSFQAGLIKLTDGRMAPDDHHPLGTNLFFNTNDPAVDFADLCDETAKVEIFSDKQVQVRDGETLVGFWGTASAPFDNSAASQRETDPDVCDTDRMLLTVDGQGMTGLGIPREGSRLRGSIDTAFAVDIDEERISEFDMTAAWPASGLHVNVPVPMPQITLDSDGKLERIDWSYQTYDAGTDSWVGIGTNTPPVIFSSVGVEVGSVQAYTWHPDDGALLRMSVDTDDFGTGVDLERMTLSYRMGPINYFFEWHGGGFCGDGVVDPATEMCDGDDLQEATCDSLGYGEQTSATAGVSCAHTCDYRPNCAPTAGGSFAEVATIDKSGAGRTSTVLADGRLLLTGGYLTPTLALAFDPTDNSVTPVGSLGTSRYEHRATLLNDGRVLISGGKSDLSGPATVTTELFDPTTDTFSPGPDMSVPRQYHSSTILPDGRVLIAGGSSQSTVYADAEIFDPTDDSFTASTPMSVPRHEHSATSTLGGYVTIYGGLDEDGYRHTTGEYWDTDQSLWMSISDDSDMGRSRHSMYWFSDSNTLLTIGGICSPPGRKNQSNCGPEYRTWYGWEPVPYNGLASGNGAFLPSGELMFIDATVPRTARLWYPATRRSSTICGGGSSTCLIPNDCIGPLRALDDGRVMVVGTERLCMFAPE